MQLFLSLWLAAFAIQSANLLAAVVPDECVEDTRGSSADPCSDDCARCVCCARVPVFVPQMLAPATSTTFDVAEALPPIDFSTSPEPRGILHVPKAL